MAKLVSDTMDQLKTELRSGPDGLSSMQTKFESAVSSAFSKDPFATSFDDHVKSAVGALYSSGSATQHWLQATLEDACPAFTCPPAPGGDAGKKT